MNPVPALRDYQVPVLEAACRGPLAALFLGWGAGKTCLALERARRRDAFPALVLCRPDDRKTWRDEAERLALPAGSLAFAGYDEIGLPVGRANHPLSGKQQRRRRERLRRIHALVDRFPPFRSLIADQSECLKNPRSQRTEGALYLADQLRATWGRIRAHKAERDVASPTHVKELPDVTILTGCPTPQSEMQELWAQVRFLDGGQALGRRYWDWIERNAIIAQTPLGTEILWTPERRQRVLESIAHLTHYVDEKKIYQDLPPKVVRAVDFGPRKEDLKTFHEIAERFETPEGEPLNSHMAVVQALRGFAAGLSDDRWKPNLKTRWIEKELPRKAHRAVVFASFTDEIKGLAAYFECPALTGEMTVKQREQVREDFAAGNHRLLVCQVALGIGLNELAAADAAVFTSPPWSNRLYSEAVARIVRPDAGKRHPAATRLQVFHLRAFPIDHAIFSALARHRTVNDWIRARGWLAWKRRYV